MNHIEFMGIPLEGTSKEFFTKLKSSAQIYSVEKESDNEVKCQLSFTGKWAHVIISGNPVYWISVELHYGYGITDPTIEEWNQIVDDYYDYKDALSKKYGSPSVSKQETTYNGDRRDSMEILRKQNMYKGYGNWLYQPECYSTFKTKVGDIHLHTAMKGQDNIYWFNGLEISYSDNYNKAHPFKPEETRFKDL